MTEDRGRTTADKLLENIEVVEMYNITSDKAIQMGQSLRELHDTTALFLNQCGNQPSLNSQASRELSIFVRPELLDIAYSQAGMLIEVVADQLIACTKTISEPALTIAPWTCLRAEMESGAIASWLLDSAIDAKTRVQRSLALRYEELDQQVKFGRAIGDDINIPKALQRIDQVEQVALELGFSKVENRKGERIGIAQQMPPVTNIVKTALDEEANYRVFSAAIHGHSWALQQLSFRRVLDVDVHSAEKATDERNRPILEKHLEPMLVAFLCLTASNVFAKTIWSKCQLFGWNLEHLGNILDTAFDSMGFVKGNRFWRTQRN